MLYFESPKNALVRAINANNHLQPPLNPASVTFGQPETWIQGATNTRVQVQAADNDYTGGFTHYYNRVRIYDQFAGHLIPGKATDYKTLREAVAAFYKQYQLPYDVADLIDYALTPTATSVSIQALNSSLMFVPNLSATVPFAG